MDLRMLNAAPTAAERAAVDRVLGPPTSGWDGGAFDAESGRVSVAGHAQRSRRHLLLPALHAVRDTTGWLSEGGLGYLCERLTIPPAEAYGVATFYALLGMTERSGPTMHVCDDVVCGARGAQRLTELVADGIDAVASPCLGGCHEPPAILEDPIGASLTQTGATPPTPQPREGLVLLRRVGAVDPSSFDDYVASGGGEALRAARKMSPDELLDEIEVANLRGRGGAAFPVAMKWRGVREAAGEIKHVVANGDESEPGTFKDRVLMEADPHAVIEGLLIAAAATGANRGWVYVRAEYPTAIARLRAAIGDFERADLSAGVELELRVGAGAYICGEETSLFASIEGLRGEPRQKPPFPTTHGLFAQPTAINNIETLVSALSVLIDGGSAFASTGTPESSGPKLFSISGAVATPGVYELPYGTSLRSLIELAGGDTDDIGAVLLGGAAGTFVGAEQIDVPLSLEGTAAIGATLGSGAVVVFADGTDFGPVVQRIAAFFRDESCGKCVPCRVGTVRQEESLIRLGAGQPLESPENELAILADLDTVMTEASICGLGRTAASAIRSAIALELPGVIG